MLNQQSNLTVQHFLIQKPLVKTKDNLTTWVYGKSKKFQFTRVPRYQLMLYDRVLSPQNHKELNHLLLISAWKKNYPKYHNGCLKEESPFK